MQNLAPSEIVTVRIDLWYRVVRGKIRFLNGPKRGAKVFKTEWSGSGDLVSWSEDRPRTQKNFNALPAEAAIRIWRILRACGVRAPWLDVGIFS